MKKDLLNFCQDRKRKSYNVEQPFQSFIISSLFVTSGGTRYNLTKKKTISIQRFSN